MRCQGKVAEGLPPGFDCPVVVSDWRQCGSGAAVKCKLEIGYCDKHGGMARATEEMAKHMEAHR